MKRIRNMLALTHLGLALVIAGMWIIIIARRYLA